MEVIAKARFIRISPKKVRLVADLVRGLDVSSAEAQLKFIRKAAALPVLKVVMSAKANAVHNFKLEGEGLFIKSITVDGGPVLHRWMPRAFGRATPLRKRSSHITVIIDERSAEVVPQAVAKAVVAKKAVKVVESEVVRTEKGQSTEDKTAQVQEEKTGSDTAQSGSVQQSETKKGESEA
ncbi:50S ribosomal protein L22 [Candidatus Uhrbacteria bacterium CG_4_10_14_0_8_um_filter_58_22]|uniref:Large ribosomal subunit protein uL22 n=1 Tax=Candidatus Uhrbacteria bacterium CG_4_10_14_0_8_um_filter_58_22 TaxID=1975029 RepID=A0A2M7Q9P4_9BACT|nr:MAG: 50S ribosomal protein L22 [Parcubacteria group bacterium CG1_02_58_44]PIY62400.1 MAG: 50S ribosomal protein L22 [Candidatus Uhrbacteria bacterium CG_4_10_14_0_8_um_filter_58_22]